VLVARGQHGHVGKQPEITQIEGAVVRGAVGAGESCPVGSDVEVSPSFARELFALGLAKPFVVTAAEPKKKK
jgi:hypothetical protein